MNNVTEIDSYRQHVNEFQRCENCGHEQISTHLADVVRKYWECGKCGEVACKAVDEPRK